MKKIFSLLLMLLFLATSVDAAFARDNKPKKRNFKHTESSKGKNSRARFRKENKPPVIDLTPKKLETFKTARANPNYKFAKAR